MTAKLIQYYDVISGKEEEFKKFVYRNYIPGIQDMGLIKIVGAWHVATGEGPYCIFESIADSVKDINRLLQMEEFTKLNNLFHFLVTNYKTKILSPTGIISEEIPKNRNFRFNHHYNINYDFYEEYIKFVTEEHIPTMEKLGIKIIGRWHVAIGPGPHVVVEGSCTSTKQILETIGSHEYRFLTSKMLGMVDDFGSKILVPMELLN